MLNRIINIFLPRAWQIKSRQSLAVFLSIVFYFISSAICIYFSVSHHSIALLSFAILYIFLGNNGIVLYSAVRQSVRSPELSFNIGYSKYSNLSVLLKTILTSSLLLFLIFWFAFNPGYHEALIHAEIIYLLGIISIINITLYFFLKQVAKKSRNRLLLKISGQKLIDSLVSIILLAAFYFLGSGYIPHAGLYFSGILLACLPALIYLFPDIIYFREAVIQLLDKTVAESIQFDILAVISENIHKICEFRTVHAKQSGKYLYINIDLVMPFDYSLEECFKVETDIAEAIKQDYPNSITRIYIVPCDQSCKSHNSGPCPFKQKDNRPL